MSPGRRLAVRRRLLALGLVAVATTATAVLAHLPEPASAWTPRASAVAAIDAPPPDAGESISGAISQRLSSPAGAVAARWTYLPGPAAVNARLDALLLEAIARFETGHGRPAYAPEARGPEAGLRDRGCVEGSAALPADELLANPRFAPPVPSGPRLAITCEIATASGTAFGERLRIVEGEPGEVTRDETTTIFANAASSTVATGRELLAPGAPAIVWRAAVRAMRSSLGAMWDVEIAPPAPDAADELANGIRDIGLRDDGLLSIDLASRPDAPEVRSLAGGAAAVAAGPMTLVVSPGELPGLLSPAGEELTAAAGAGASFAGPAPSTGDHDHANCALTPCVALTYDDGPDANVPGLLDAYDARDAAATFFFIGQFIASHEDVVRRASDEGFEIGSHSWSHPDLNTLPAEQVRDEVARTSSAIEAITGRPVALFRPPYGSNNATVHAATGGTPIILWDIDTIDWQDPGAATVVERVVTQAKPGSIVLMHSPHAGTFEAAPEILDGLADRGFTMVTVPTLYGGVMPGKLVRPRP